MLATISQPVARRSSAEAAVQRFLPNAGRRYATSRNFDFGPDSRDNVSRLSPYQRHRLILESQLVQHVLSRHPWPAPEKFIQEVFWRTYFKGWLEHRPAVWRDYQRDLARLADALESDSELLDRYRQASGGLTGIDCFDAWVGELRDTGYLHNHARMWFASIWVFTLGLPWQLGADFFLQHLLDGDPASNTLSWRWVCGLHTRGKTYLARASNIARYTDGRFNPEGLLASAAPPVEDDRQYATQTLATNPTVAPDEPFALLVTAEDCSPDTLAVNSAPAVVIALDATPSASPLAECQRARAFAAEAVADGAQYASRQFGAQSVISGNDDWLNELVNIAQGNKLSTIVTGYAPVGPVAHRLATITPTLASHGVRLEALRRPWDSASWPHATRGYFGLKKKIPALLQQLGVL